jgi:hypothetical protein
VTDEPTYPYPRRFRWLKRNLLIAAIVTTAFISLMIFWRHAARRRLDAEVAAIHARGEPILIEDFAVPPVPNELNAALSLKNAAAAIVPNQAYSNFVDNNGRDRPIDPATMKTLEQVAKLSAKPRELARLARFQPGVNWGTPIPSPPIRFSYPNLNLARDLGNLFATNAVYEHAAGRDAEAIEIIRDQLHHADLLDQDNPSFILHLVSVGLTNLTSDTIRSISSDLKISPESAATTQPNGIASHQQVKLLIAELLDERAYRAGFVRAMQGERMFDYNTLQNVASFASSIGIQIQRLPLRPMLELDAIHLMRMSTQCGIAGSKPDFQTAKTSMPDMNFIGSGTQDITATKIVHVMSSLLTLSYDRFLQTHFSGLTERRIAAMRLAIRLYQIDHNNEFPNKLAELVPNYLQALPADPFAADGRPFGYRKSPIPFLYSVGLNGKDDGGDTTLLKPKPVSVSEPGTPAGNRRWDRLDAPFRLDKYIAPPPTTNED